MIGFFNYDRNLRLLPEAGVREIDQLDFRRYQSHYAALNPFTKVMRRKRLLNRTVALSRYLPTAELVETEYFNDFMRPHGEKYALSMSLLFRDFGRASLTLYRGDRTGGDFSAVDVRRFDQLRPFVRNALLLRALVRERGQGGKGLDSVGDPVYRLSESGDARPLNAAGEGFLCSRCKNAIPNPHDDRWRAGPARFIPVDPAGAQSAGFVVTVPGGEPAAPFDRLRRRFGLTPTEASVALALVDGLSYKEIGAEFDISTETVHSHVKAIHRKADVGTTRQFIALFVSGR